uniref:MIF4G/MA4-domain-containing protein n=1 Tax=Mycena chlorophos TaxID=658473 RepID=A0ABQ0LKC4_MYCCL|nr:MIF4G/MA4-domain-containing protein [Mycena chlorophos]
MSHPVLAAPVPPRRLPPLETHWPLSDAGLPSPRSTRSSPFVPRRRTRTLSSFATVQRRSRLVTAIRHPPVLAALLSHLPWAATWALLNTCRDARDFFACTELKDVVLARFIPAYMACVQCSDSFRVQDVPITLGDLNLLMISSSVILHRYPMLALQWLSRLLPEVDRAEREQTARLVDLALAHSRFVLFLQALAHSSLLPPPPDQDDFDNWPPRPVGPGLRQLKFPAPLSSTTPTIEVPPAPKSAPPTMAGRKSRESELSRSLTSRSRRLSIFGGHKVPLPPASEPRSLKHYSSGWRQAALRMSSSGSDDEWGLKTLERPHRRFASSNLSSDSSSSSSSPTPPFSRSPTMEVVSPIRRFHSIHDLGFATSRTRAPVLRVFVPCSRLDERSIALCEDQLADAGLRNHLSTGDIVCNLGFVPPPSPAQSRPGSSDGLPDSARSDRSHRRKWLLFNGEALVPFFPPAPLPLSNPFILPSPFYYSHIAPPQTNPVFVIRSFPACDDIPQFTLVNTTARVRSPHSPAGFASVKQFKWTARVWRPVAQEDDIGFGWQGEWVLEGDGTREGQAILVDCLRGVVGPWREWELVREKCNGDRLWFRLLRTIMPKRTPFAEKLPNTELGVEVFGRVCGAVMRNLKKTSTTRLPQTLVDELQGKSEENGARHQKRSNKAQPARKELRKQQRLGVKQRKAQFFSAPPPQAAQPPPLAAAQSVAPKPHSQPTAAAKRASEQVDHAESPPRKKARLEEGAAPQGKPKSILKKTALEKIVDRQARPAASSLPAKLPRTQREKEEDAYIAYLEGQLGYDRKKKGKEDDGLDDLFDFAESLEFGGAGDVLEDGMAASDEESSEDDVSEDGEDEEDEWGGVGSGADEESASEETEPPPKPSTGTAYVPPHLRKTQNEPDSELQLKLTRQLKGQLNRMTEQNIASILDSIEEIYRKNRRNDVTTTLTTLIIDGIASHSSLLDSFVVLYAAFVSSLHKIIGIEFAAHFVQSVVSAYEQHYANLGTPDPTVPDAPTPKECSNLIVLVSELYNFQVISCVLVYDIIRGLLETELTEYNVDLLLKIVRNSGQQLRQDDPSSLKDIIQIVQGKTSEHTDTLSSRTRFMVETLSNLKNNKIKRNVTLNQGHDAVERMKKFLVGLGKSRHVLAHEPLRVSLKDLHSAESKGKWWLVGAAWGGDPLVDRQVQANESQATTSSESAKGEMGDSALLKLARKQGMNTDIRRSIFVVLMSSDDYVDACERLSQLNLTEVQQREIVRVLLHCCGNEKTYNPYYTLVCQHLCRSSHSYKITLQFCLWDFLRDLGEVNVGGAEIVKNLKDDDGFDLKSVSSTRLANVAKAYGWWIAKDCVTLAILKPVDFTALKAQSKSFLGELFTNIFIYSQTASPIITANTAPTARNRGSIEEIFVKATRIEALAMGLLYFLTETLGDAESELVRWASGIAKDTLRTGVDIVPSL